MLVSGEFRELPNVVPDALVGRVKKMCPIAMDLDAGLRFGLGVRVTARWDRRSMTRTRLFIARRRVRRSSNRRIPSRPLRGRIGRSAGGAAGGGVGRSALGCRVKSSAPRLSDHGASTAGTRAPEVVGCVGGAQSARSQLAHDSASPLWTHQSQPYHRRVGSFGGEQPHEGRPTRTDRCQSRFEETFVPNRRRRKISTAMSAVAALAVATPFSAIAVIEATSGAQQAPEKHEFVPAAVVTDLPNELMSALQQGLSQLGSTCLCCRPGLSPAGAQPVQAGPALTTPSLGMPSASVPGLTTPSLSGRPVTTTPSLDAGSDAHSTPRPRPDDPGLTTPSLARPDDAQSDLTPSDDGARTDHARLRRPPV